MTTKVKIKNRLDKKKETGLFIKLAKSLSSLRSAEEGAQFLKDLLSEGEVLILAKRLEIAELLLQGQTYQAIRNDLKVAFNTIARVQTWLDIYGEGYRTVINRIKPPEKPMDFHDPIRVLKRKYPMYFWPQLLLEEIVKTANKKEKEKLLKVVDQLKDKTRLSKQLKNLLQ
jgi:TrpR-related protein YerC/YecD